MNQLCTEDNKISFLSRFQFSKLFGDIGLNSRKYWLAWALILLVGIAYFWLIIKMAKALYYKKCKSALTNIAIYIAIMVFLFISSLYLFPHCKSISETHSSLIFSNFFSFLKKYILVISTMYLISAFHSFFFKSIIFWNLTLSFCILLLMRCSLLTYFYVFGALFLFYLVIVVLAISYADYFTLFEKRMHRLTKFMNKNLLSSSLFYTITSVLQSLFVCSLFKLIRNGTIPLNIFVCFFIGIYIGWVLNFFYSVNIHFDNILLYASLKTNQSSNIRNCISPLLASFKLIAYKNLIPVNIINFLIYMNRNALNLIQRLKYMELNVNIYSFIIWLENIMQVSEQIMIATLQKHSETGLILDLNCEISASQDIYIQEQFTIYDFFAIKLYRLIILIHVVICLIFKQVLIKNSKHFHSIINEIHKSFGFSDCVCIFLGLAFLNSLNALYPNKKSNNLQVNDPLNTFNLEEKRWVGTRVYLLQ